MNLVQHIVDEFIACGYSSVEAIDRRSDHSYIIAVIDYDVQVGQYFGNNVKIGIQFPVDFPTTHPHFIHIPKYHVLNGGESQPSDWRDDYLKWSRPPSDFWSTLPPDYKTVRTYMNLHMPRVWK